MFNLSPCAFCGIHVFSIFQITRSDGPTTVTPTAENCMMLKIFHTSCFRDVLQLVRFNIFNRKLIDHVLGSLQEKSSIKWNIYHKILLNVFFGLVVSKFLYLGDVSCSSEAKCEGSNGFGHKPHWNFIPTIPDCLDGLAHIPIVMSHTDVLDMNHVEKRTSHVNSL